MVQCLNFEVFKQDIYYIALLSFFYVFMLYSIYRNIKFYNFNIIFRWMKHWH